MASSTSQQSRAQAPPPGQFATDLLSLASHDLTAIQAQHHEVQPTPEQALKLRREVAAARAAREHATASEIEGRGITPNLGFLVEAARSAKRPAEEDCDMDRAQKKYRTEPLTHIVQSEPSILSLPEDFIGRFSKLPQTLSGGPFGQVNSILACNSTFDLLSSICTSTELIINVCQYLKPKDIVALYKASKLFYETFRASFKANVWQLANGMAPGAARTFYWKFYPQFCIRDPTGALPTVSNTRFIYPWHEKGSTIIQNPVAPVGDGTARAIPGLQWLNFIVDRDRKIRDIIACLARSGHRLPRNAYISIRKMWLIMDVATNKGREALMRSRHLFSDYDLYNLQMFFIKLQMRFNEPIFGPGSPALMWVLLGQETGLDVMWEMLRRKKYASNFMECIQLQIRYKYRITMQEFVDMRPIMGVSMLEVGSMHLEGWGRGPQHLKRPDELVIEEAARRSLPLKDHYMNMAVWGHVDPKKKTNLVPTEEEMYMSDDDLPPMHPKHPDAPCGNVPFHPGEWLPKHARKARWDSLNQAEKDLINAEDCDEQLRDLIYELEVPDAAIDFSILEDDELIASLPKPAPGSTYFPAPEPAPPFDRDSELTKDLFKVALQKSGYDQAQQDKEMAAFASQGEPQPDINDMDLDDFLSDNSFYVGGDDVEIEIEIDENDGEDENEEEYEDMDEDEDHQQNTANTRGHDVARIERPEYDFRRF